MSHLVVGVRNGLAGGWVDLGTCETDWTRLHDLCISFSTFAMWSVCHIRTRVKWDCKVWPNLPEEYKFGSRGPSNFHTINETNLTQSGLLDGGISGSGRDYESIGGLGPNPKPAQFNMTQKGSTHRECHVVEITFIIDRQSTFHFSPMQRSLRL